MTQRSVRTTYRSQSKPEVMWDFLNDVVNAHPPGTRAQQSTPYRSQR